MSDDLCSSADVWFENWGAEVRDGEAFEGLSIDFQFRDAKPTFGDLFEIVGFQNPNFPPTGRFAFRGMQDLHFTQVDDYFGVRNASGEGDDVIIWLYPLSGSEAVHHHPGPFDAIRLHYNVLRNPARRLSHLRLCIETLIRVLPVKATFRGAELESSSQIIEAAEQITEHWRSKNIVVGSNEALEIDY